MLIAEKNRIKVTNNFFLDELIHPDYYDGSRNPERFLDRRIVEALQLIRNWIDEPITVNNWAVGGNRQFSGLRPMNSSIGAKYSQHKFGRAFDLVTKRPVAEMHDVLRTLEQKGHLILSGRITRVESLEATPTWTHIDNAYTGMDKLHFFKP